MDSDLNQKSPPATLIKIKEEPLDPEIQAKIKAVEKHIKKEVANGNGCENGQDEDSSSNETPASQADPAEDKKSIEPVKSSNEILAELFRVFNAAPPDELLDDKNLGLKKAHKSRKVKKEKKEKKKKPKRSKSIGELDEAGKESDKKHKKKKKHKEREKDTDKSVAAASRDKDKSREKHDQLKEPEKCRDRERDKRDKSADSKEKRSDKDRDERKKTLSQRIKEELDCASSRKRHSSSHLKEELPSKREARDVTGRDKEQRSDRHNSFYNGSERRVGGESNERERNSNPFKVKAEPSSSSEHKQLHQRDNNSSRRHREHERDGGHISEISLSDEETYLKERSDAGRRRPTSRRGGDAGETRVTHNSFYGGIPAQSHSHERDRDRDRERERDRERDRDRNRYRGDNYDDRRRRRNSRSRSHDLGIDKKRLLEIARKNAISMFKRGNLPGCAEMTEELKDKVLLKMRYGGRSVQDLTDFCKKISNGENLSDLTSDEDSDVDKGGNAKAFHHPFLLKEREPIVMHIRNATPILPRPKTDDQTKAITAQFPVSSGQQHRMTEAWVPVAEPKEKLVPLPLLPVATQSTSIFKSPAPMVSAEKNVFAKPMPAQEQQEPAFKAVVVEPTATTTVVDASAASFIVPSPVPPVVNASTAIAAIPIPPPPTKDFVPDVPVPSTTSSSSTPSIFPQAAAGASSIDVSSIISKRLNAMRRLQDNPMDSEAIKMMYNSQREMTCWASSKHLPGQFTGSTGVNVLTMRELNSGPQMWARRDQLTSTQPIHGGTGMMLLQKMGWKPGEGLGREKSGSLQPLLLDVKLDKRGLVSKEDNGYKPPQPSAKVKRSTNVAQAQQNIEDKHPVCLLNELTSKRKWTPPLYELVNEVGPSHSKNFMFSVSINGQTFTPSQASNTKKEAKVVAARFCLQRMGIIP